MNNEKYNELIKTVLPKTFTFKKCFLAFISGGLIGVLAELLIKFYSGFEGISKNEASSLMMVTLIFVASLLTALGIFDKLVTKYGAGLIVPITGFSHSTTSAAIEYKKEGLVYGIGANIFKLSGSVILYGIISAYIFGIIRYIIFGG